MHTPNALSTWRSLKQQKLAIDRKKNSLKSSLLRMTRRVDWNTGKTMKFTGTPPSDTIVHALGLTWGSQKQRGERGYGKKRASSLRMLWRRAMVMPDAGPLLNTDMDDFV